MILIKEFNKIGKDDISLAGGKGASLGEMTKAGIPVPGGFVVLASAFEKFLEKTDLNVEIDAILDDVKHEQISTIENASEKIQALILQSEIPQDITSEIQKIFKNLNSKYVAVRSSATAEDSASAAWAGQLESYLNTTEKDLLENVKKCWASLFTPRAIFYRFEKDLHKQKISVAVVVQKMVESEKSGIAFSVHPVTQDRNQLIIEAGFGLGEAVVSGQITPDSYVVEKQPRRIIDKNIQTQAKGLYRAKHGGNEWHDIPKAQGEKQVLSDKDIFGFSEIILEIENHYGFPCDIEWAFENGKFYIVQSRPITTLREELVKNSKLILSHKEVNVSGFTISVNFWGWINKWLNKTCGIENFGTMACLFRNYEMDFYIEKRKFEKAHDEISKKIATDSLPIDYAIKKSESIGEKILQIIISNYPKLEKVNANKVCKLVSEVFDYSRQLCSFGYIAPLSDFPVEFITPRMDEILKKRNNKDVANLKIFLSTPRRKRPMIIANEELLEKIAAKKKIQNWTNKWFWLDFGHIGSILIQKTIKKKYKVYFENPHKAKLELQKLSKENSSLKTEQEKKFEELKLSEDEKRIFLYAQKITFLKGYRTDILSASNAFFDKVFEVYAKKLHLQKTTFRFATKDEVLNLIKGGECDLGAISKRKKYSIWALNNENEGIKIYTGKDADKFRADNLSVEKIEHEGKIIKGSTAFPGVVEGVVKIVNRPSDMKKIKYGEILVSTQTTPELLPAMNKAMAFITDIGGITSHAAIVAREMRKPCIVGTKIASKILKDGDKVKVDANNGIIELN